MKKLILFLLLGCLLFCACAQGEPITSEYFGRVMAEKGFRVEDHTEYLDPALPESRDAERIKAWGEFLVCFDKYADSEKAEEAFAALESYYEARGECKRIYNDGRYMHYEFTDYDGTEKAYILSRLENTLIEVSANIEFAEEAKQLLEELGYGR